MLPQDELFRTKRQLEARTQELDDLKSNASDGGSEARAHQVALERTLLEFSDIKAEYARVSGGCGAGARGHHGCGGYKGGSSACVH